MKTFWHENGRQEILGRLDTLSPDLTRQWGRMNVHQMVCHLSDSFRMAMGDRQSPHLGNLFTRTVVKWMALYLPAPWPKGTKTLPVVDQDLEGTKPIEFAPDVATLKGLIERFSSSNRDFELRPHPIFGRMSETEWMRWGYLHCDHHFRQFGI